MKKRLIIISSLFVLMGTFSCQDDEKDPWIIHEDRANDGVFPTLTVNNGVVDTSNPDSAYSITIDSPRGNIASYDLSATRVSQGVTTGPVPIVTLTSFPSDINLKLADLAAAFGIETSEILAADTFNFTATAVGTNGKTASFANLNGDSRGPGMFNAFNFSLTIKCAPISDATVAGTWIVDMVDLYGDGWDGAFLTFEVDGVSTVYTATGDGTVHTIEVPAGTSNLVITYTSGAFEEEHVFSITSPDGAYGEYGPNPDPCVN
ncbi:hypothetical protein ACEZ3G_01115 [Maribacter algicola]|uniref:Uncharacterized protein n=1 Tax=Meishania litoralis TaxID=3434685 RepID=A0ACC7LFY5_9FLAO